MTERIPTMSGTCARLVSRPSMSASGLFRTRRYRRTSGQCGTCSVPIPFAPNGEFLEPDQADATCPAIAAKINRFAFRPNQIHKPRRPASHEGRFAIVTNVGCGMRWTLEVRQTNAQQADGEVVWA
jgi:hypothetical protein